MRRFRPLQESINICEKMLVTAEYFGDASEIVYWTKRRNGYLKLASQNSVQVKTSLHGAEDKE